MCEQWVWDASRWDLTGDLHIYYTLYCVCVITSGSNRAEVDTIGEMQYIREQWMQLGSSGCNQGAVDAIYQGTVDPIGEQWIQLESSGSDWSAVDPIGQ